MEEGVHGEVSTHGLHATPESLSQARGHIRVVSVRGSDGESNISWPQGVAVHLGLALPLGSIAGESEDKTGVASLQEGLAVCWWASDSHACAVIWSQQGLECVRQAGWGPQRRPCIWCLCIWRRACGICGCGEDARYEELCFREQAALREMADSHCSQGRTPA